MSKMQKYAVVDAFTQNAFGGNPAAVCVLEKPLSEALLASIAAEFNLSETAYLIPAGENRWNLRWFTPTTEVNLCGHATLAAAWVLWQEHTIEAAQLRFNTRSGELSAERMENGVQLNFPLTHTTPLAASQFMQSLFPGAQAFVSAGEDLLVELADEAAVEALVPNLSGIAGLPYRGVSVTAAAENKHYQVVSRFFAPRFGINEDPVTGSLHCALADYWGQKLKLEQFWARQASHRGGLLRVSRAGQRVHLWGQAVITMRGELQLPA
jgi:PhzF family phenazine biosynthesis protein